MNYDNKLFLLPVFLKQLKRSRGRPPVYFPSTVPSIGLSLCKRLMLPFTDADLNTEISTKDARLQDFMQQKKLAGILLTQVRNFEWATGGVGDNQVGRASEVGAASLLHTKDGRKFVIAAHSEIPRLIEDGLGRLQ